jgi:hypothetical protein
VSGQHGTIGTIMIILIFLQGMLDGQHGTIGMIVPVLVVEVTVYVIETVVIQHGTILVAINDHNRSNCSMLMSNQHPL